MPCWLLGQKFPIVGGPVFGILAGMIVTLLWRDKTAAQPGISFVSKKVLQYAVILLGFGMNLSVIWQTGKQSLPIILVTGAVVSFLRRSKREALVQSVANNASGSALRSMSWQEFELLVGETFRMRGYAVTEGGGGGADGDRGRHRGLPAVRGALGHDELRVRRVLAARLEMACHFG